MIGPRGSTASGSCRGASSPPRAERRPGLLDAARRGRSCAARCSTSSAPRALMLALALPALGLHLTGGDNRGVPLTTESTRGLALLERTLGPGALAPEPDRRRHRPRRRRAAAGDGARPSAGWSPRCARDPEVEAQTIQAPALPRADAGRAAAAAPGQPRRPERPGRCRSASPGTATRAPTRRSTSSTASATATSRPPASARPTSSSPARRRSASTSSTGLRRLPVARRSRCSCSPTCCCCARSARWSCRSRRCS